MGAGPSSPPKPETSSPASQSSPETPSSSPFSLPPSPASSPSMLCQFSKEQADEFDKVIKVLKDSEFQMLTETANSTTISPNVKAKLFFLTSRSSFNDNHNFLKDQDINQHHLLIKRILCSDVIHILKAYKIVLEEIVKLCSKCQIERDVQNVNAQVDTIMDTFQEANEMFVLFTEIYKQGDIGGDGYGTNIYEALVESTKTIHDMFKNTEKVKDDMKEMCRKREELIGLRDVVFKGMGGNRLRSKKRKQMKMKMKSSNYRSKTRNSKKKYNRKSVKK